MTLYRQQDRTGQHVIDAVPPQLQFSKQLSLWASGTTWRAYDDYIGGRIMYEGYSNWCIKGIMESPQINLKIRQLAEEHVAPLKLTSDARRKRLERTERQMREVVYEMAHGLVAKMDSVRFLRFFGAVVNNILVRMYDQGSSEWRPQKDDDRHLLIGPPPC